MTGRLHILGALLPLLLLPLAQNTKELTKQQKKLLKLEQDFAKQTDPVHQAKALAKLLPKEIDEAAAEIRKGGIDSGVARLEQYRDETRKVHEALLATERNPVKKSAGFVQLQIALRESVRRLNDLIFLMPIGRRTKVEEVRADLAQINSQLLEELFPPPKPKEKKH